MSRPADAVRGGVAWTSLRYAAGLVFAHLLSVAEVLIVVVALRGRSPDNPHFSEHYVATTVALSLLSTLAVLIGGVWIIARSLRWFLRGDVPTPAQRVVAVNIIRDQSGSSRSGVRGRVRC
ncbi:hypothetical protein [[Mycobacterium] vasticus]|uniref:Uncharacterized protein n=1 Tax=[Mycobacterium] vasticus TaxID=2875777 RepID=A0ABU5Z187_9MYCO|nr:hypothetical protein [Mycolicibacter sp. MYC017]MEB3071155.1 hypothetical protein [Mycolicibacter sp. MYC017]